MASIAKAPVSIARNIAGGPPMQEWYPEAATQTFKLMEPVYLDGSGYVTLFNAAADSGSQRWLGYAAQAGQNLTVRGVANGGATLAQPSVPGKAPVYLGRTTIYEANITSAGSDQVSALTQVGDVFPMYYDATNRIQAIDIAKTGSKISSARLLNFIKGTIGDTNARAEYTLIDTALQVLGN